MTEDDADDDADAELALEADAELALGLLVELTADVELEAELFAELLLAVDCAETLLAALAEDVAEDEEVLDEAVALAGADEAVELAELDDEGACDPAHPTSASVAASAPAAITETTLLVAMFFLSIWISVPAHYRGMHLKQIKFY